MREQDNISVHSNQMSEPPPPPSPPSPPTPQLMSPPIQEIHQHQTHHSEPVQFQHQIFNATTVTNHDADAKAQQQKRRMPPALLTEEQKQIGMISHKKSLNNNLWSHA